MEWPAFLGERGPRRPNAISLAGTSHCHGCILVFAKNAGDTDRLRPRVWIQISVPGSSHVHPSELVSGRVCVPAPPGSGGGGTSFLPPRVAETVNSLSRQKACSRGTLPGSSSVMCGCWKEPCLQPSHLQSTQLSVPDPKPAAQPRYAQAGPSDPACLLHPPPHTHTTCSQAYGPFLNADCQTLNIPPWGWRDVGLEGGLELTVILEVGTRKPREVTSSGAVSEKGCRHLLGSAGSSVHRGAIPRNLGRFGAKRSTAHYSSLRVLPSSAPPFPPARPAFLSARLVPTSCTQPFLSLPPVPAGCTATGTLPG